MQVAEIAARQSIPDRYLEQMLTTLRRGGILRSIRGPKGGYQLMRAPSEVLVADVVSCLEGESSTKDTPTRPTPEFEVLLELDDLKNAERQLIEADILVRDHIGPAHAMRNRVRAYLRETLEKQDRADEARRLWGDVDASNADAR